MVDVIIDMSAPIADIARMADVIPIADKAAVRQVAESLVIPAMKHALSFTGGKAPIGMLGLRTGRLQAQLRAKYWKGRDGLFNSSVRVIGNRGFVARLNETGTSKHGRKGGPLPARRMFATVGAALRTTIEARMVSEFERNMKALGYA